MHRLLLLRHAKSDWGDPALTDHARPLNARGTRAAAAMREVIQGLCPAPDVILVSSARRTMQTLEALAPWRETPMAEVMDQLYLASAAQILAVLNGLAETVRSAMVIGHNPGMHELACLLAGASATPRLHAGYPTAALAAFSIPGPWRPLGAGGAELVRFIRPKDIPGMADATED